MSEPRSSCCCRWFCFISEEKTKDDIPTTRSMPSRDPISKEGAVDVPDWLDTILIEEALHRLGDKNLHVERIHVSMATAPGDNYGSVLYRVKAVLSEGSGQRSFLVKAPPAAPAIAQSVKEVALFWRESTMLARLVPQMEALLQEVTPKRWSPLAARCPLHRDTPVEFLVLEDLSPEGFGMAERHRGMGLRHSILAFRALARYHAASHALLKRDPAAGKGLDNPLRRQSDSGNAMFLIALHSTAKACRSWPGYEGYADDIEAFKKTAVAKLTELHDAKPGAFNVILHGDFWINNIMYKYAKGKPKDLRFVDFQISHVASPALDVLYFLSTSLSEDVSENYCGLLLREYHSSLWDTLELLGLEAPSLKAFLQDVNDHGAYAVYGTTVLLPILKSTKVPDVSAVASGDAEAGMYMYKDPVVKEWLQRVLPDFKRRGWLDG